MENNNIPSVDIETTTPPQSTLTDWAGGEINDIIPTNTEIERDILPTNREERFMPTFSGPQEISRASAGGGSSDSSKEKSVDELFEEAQKTYDTSQGAMNRSDISERYALTLPGIDNEEMHAQSQTTSEKAYNGVVKMAGIAGTTFVNGTAGIVYGVAEMAKTGKVSSFYNNDLTNWLNNTNKEWEDKFAHYKTKRELNGSWWEPSNLFTANFLFDNIIKNLGFAAGAAASGFAWGAAIKSIGLTAQLIGRGEAMATAAEAVISEASTVASAGRIAAVENNLSTLLKQNVGKALMKTDQGIVATFGSFGEAGMEALSNSQSFRDAKIEEYKNMYGVAPSGAELESINQAAESIGNWTLGLNVALLTATNYVQLPKIFSSSFKGEKAQLNNVIRNEIGDYVSGLPSSKLGKFAYKAKNIASLGFNTAEAFEEGAQFAIQTGTENYFDKKRRAVEETSAMDDGVLYGIKQALTTNEGTLNIFTGGFSGALQSSGLVGIKKTESGMYLPTIASTGKIGERGFTGYGGKNAEARENQISDLQATKLKTKLKEAYANVKLAEVIQEERAEKIRNGEVLESKDLEFDYAHTFIDTRLKYGAKESIDFEIEQMRNQAITNEGFTALKEQEKVGGNDTKEAFLMRLDNLQEHANKAYSLQESIKLKYGGLVDKEGKSVYTDEVISRLVYHGAKVSNYDLRIPQVAETALMLGIDVDTLIKEELENTEPSALNSAILEINANDDILSTEKDDIIQGLKDVVTLSKRRKENLLEYKEILASPKEYQSTPYDGIEEENKPEEKISITTAGGVGKFVINNPYVLGKVTKFTEEEFEVYDAPEITILGENEDGTIKIKASNGNIKDISKGEFEKYKLVDKKELEKNKKADYVFKHWNVVFKHKGIKNKQGNPTTGRLTYDQDRDLVLFNYRDKNGKLKQIVVVNEDFRPQKGYKEAKITKGIELKATKAQQKAEEAFLKEKMTLPQKIQARKAIIGDLYTESTERIEAINKKLEANNERLESLKTKIQERKDSQEEKLTKTGSQRKRTTAILKSLLSELTSLTKTVSEDRISLLEEKEELESALPFIKNFFDEVNDLPENSTEILKDLKEDIKTLEDVIDITNQAIKSNQTLLDAIEKLFNTAISLVNNYIEGIKAKFPNTSIFLDEYQEKLEKYYGEEGAKQIIENKQELTELVTQIQDDVELFAEEANIPVLEKNAEKLNKEITELQEGLKTLIAEHTAKSKILKAFEYIVENQKKEALEESNMRKNAMLHEEIFGTHDPNRQSDFTALDNYEPISKKTTEGVLSSTISAGRDRFNPTTEEYEKVEVAAHHERSDRFGARLTSLNNSEEGGKNIKGITVNHITQNEILPGLTEHIFSTIPKDKRHKYNSEDIIVMVMVQEEEDGSFSLVDEFGEVIPKMDVNGNHTDFLNTAIYQTFPVSLKTNVFGKSESMFRKEVPAEVIEELEQQHKAWREKVKTSPLPAPRKITPSSGIFQYVKQTTDQGKTVNDNFVRVPVEDSKLIDESDLATQQVLMVSTSPIVAHGTTVFEKAMGRVFLKLSNTLVKTHNRKLTSDEVNVVYQTLLQIATISRDKGSVKNDECLRLFDWLRSKVYWGTPKKEAGYNSLWFQHTSDGPRLFISSKSASPFEFTPTALESNEVAIKSILSKLYHNVNSKKTNIDGINTAHYEIIGFDQDGSPITEKWNNYQTYLLSNKNHTGDKPRSADQIPLITRIKPIKGEEVNRESIYFSYNDISDDFTIPEIKKKEKQEAPAKKKQEEPAKKTTNSGPYDGKTPLTYTKVNEAGEKVYTLNFTINKDEYVFEEGKEVTGIGFDITDPVNDAALDVIAAALKTDKENARNGAYAIINREFGDKIKEEEAGKKEEPVDTMVPEETPEDPFDGKTKLSYTKLDNDGNPKYTINFTINKDEYVFELGKEVKGIGFDESDPVNARAIEVFAETLNKSKEEAKDYVIPVIHREYGEQVMLAKVAKENEGISPAAHNAVVTNTPKSNAFSFTEDNSGYTEYEEVVGEETSDDSVNEEIIKEIPAVDDLLNSFSEELPEDDPPFRLQIQREYESGKNNNEDWVKLEGWIKENFPNIPVHRVKNIIKATNGKEAWGMLQDGAIYVYENAEVGTIYHEVFEAVWKMFTTPKERQKIIDEFRAQEGSYTDRFSLKTVKYSEASHVDLKEELAERFRDFILEGNPLKKKSWLMRLFEEILDFIEHFFVGKDALYNTNKLFDKIGTGYYSTYNPYKNALSYANRGIINVDNAYPGINAEYSLVKDVPVEQVHDIIQEMTYQTLGELIKSDEDLFKSIRPSAGIYERLKVRILGNKELGEPGIIVRKIRNYLTEMSAGRISTEFGTEKINNLKQLHTIVSRPETWNEIKARHIEKLTSLSIQYDESDFELLNDENNSGKEDYIDSRKIDSFKKANPAIKMLLASLPKVTKTEGKLNFIPNSVGGVQLLPADSVYIDLMSQLYTSTNAEEMVESLRQAAIKNINYEILYKRVTKQEVSNPTDFSIIDRGSIKIITAFWKSFNKQNLDVITVFTTPAGEVVIGDSNLASSAKKTRGIFRNDIIAKIREDKNPYIVYNKEEGTWNPSAGISKVVLGSKELAPYLSFLKTIGIEFSKDKLEEKLNDNQITSLKESVTKIHEGLSKIKDIKSLNKYTLDLEGRLLELGAVEAVLSNPEFETTYFNINGEKAQVFLGTNAMNNLFNALSKIKNLNDLASDPKYAQYRYLLTDVFTNNGGSIILSRMFDLKTGKRKKVSKDILKPALIDGSVNEESGKSVESAKLKFKERVVQELNLNLNGVYLNLVPGDAAMEHSVRMHTASTPFVSRDDYKNNTHLEIFKQYFISEVNLARDKRKTVSGNSDDLRFFKSLLENNMPAYNKIKKEISQKSKSTEEIYENNKKEINRAVNDFVTKEGKDLYNFLNDYGAISFSEEGMHVSGITFDNSEGITKEDLITNLELLTMNYMVSNIEYHKLLYSDPFQYTDELKRIKNFLSPRQGLLHSSPAIQDRMTLLFNKDLDVNDISYTDFGKNYFSTVTIDDVWAKGELLNYDKSEDSYEETDGGAIISLKANRIFGILSGEWTDAEEDQFLYDMAWEKEHKTALLMKESETPVTKAMLREKGLLISPAEEEMLIKGNPQVSSAYTPRKPIVSGNAVNGENFNDIMLDKDALVIYSYRVLHEINPDSNAIRHYNKMQREGRDYTIFASGRKVGKGETSALYDENGNYDETPFKETKNIPFAITGVQTEVPTKEEAKVTQATQITTLATMDTMDAGMPIDFEIKDKDGKIITDFDKRFSAWNALSSEAAKLGASDLYKEIKNNQRLLTEAIIENYDYLLKKLGIKETSINGERGFIFENTEKFVKVLREEITKREVNDNIIASFEGVVNGAVVLEATPSYKQIRNILFSIADKAVLSTKVSGAAKVQTFSTLLESKKIKAEEVVDKNGKKKMVYSSGTLKFYKNADGERVCEMMISRWFGSNKTDKELIDYLNNDPEGQKLLNGVAFRIPTQKQNSIDRFVVKQFLPKELSASVVIPSALVKKAGSDFDIDKLFMYLKNVIIGPDGFPQIMKMMETKEKTIAFYTAAVNKSLEKQEQFIQKELIKLGKQENIDVNKEQQLIALQEKLEAKRQKEIDTIYKKVLENEYIQSLENLISHPLNFDNLVKPNSADQVKNLTKDINYLLGRDEVNYKDPGNMLKRLFMSRLRHDFVTGKYAIGIGATSQTNNAKNQRYLSYINDDLLFSDVIDAEDKYWLGSGKLAFQEFNSIMVNGERKATLSKILNAAGDYISDIIGQFIDGYVDISKGAWIMELGATPLTAGTWLFLVKTGVPIKSVAYFMNQPIILEYLKDLESRNKTFLFDSIASSDIIGNYTNKKSEKSEETFIIPSEKELRNMVGNKELKEQQKEQQAQILKEFLKYAKMAEHLLTVTQASNYDTASINDPILLFKKEIQIEKAQKTIISSVDNLLDASHLRTLKEKVDTFGDMYSPILMSERPIVKNVMKKVLRPYASQSDRDFVKTTHKAINDLFDWAAQTDRKYNSSIQRILLGKETEKSSARNIMNFKHEVSKDANHALKGNMVLAALEFLPGEKDNTPDNISLSNMGNKVYDQNLVINAFRELKKYLTDNKRGELYGQLVRLSLLQSGLNTSPISFTSLLPFEDFTEIYNKSLSELESFPNIEDFYNLNVFERNNWNNKDIVFPQKEISKKSMAGNYYKPELVSLLPSLTKAVQKKTAPKLIAVSVGTYAGKHDFLNYSADNGKPNKYQRKLGRKTGDTSHIDKFLMQKVYVENEQGEKVPLITEQEYKGKISSHYIYKHINAWGDSFRAQEFYDIIKPSVINNGFMVAKEVSDKVIEDLIPGVRLENEELTTTEPEYSEKYGVTLEEWESLSQEEKETIVEQNKNC